MEYKKPDNIPQLEWNEQLFWDAINNNHNWEAVELNKYQFRCIVHSGNDKYRFDYYPKRRRITYLGSNKFKTCDNPETWIKNYLKKFKL